MSFHDAASALMVVLITAAWLTWRALRRRRLRDTGGRATPAIRIAALAAVGCTAYSADTSWRFAADYLDMGGTAERVAMFAAAELALFASSLLARQNLNGPNGAPGAPGVLVWVITGVQIIPAYAESGVVGGTVRAFVGPVMAALLWHLAMGIELRHRTPDAASSGLLALLGRELRERTLSRLGLAERNRDAAQITRDRATVRAVALAARLAEQTPRQRGRRRGQRLARRLSVAVARASVGVDAGQRRALLDQLAARRHAASLATIELPSPWDEPTADPVASALAAQTRTQMSQATEKIRSRTLTRLLFADVAPAQAVDGEERSPEHAAPQGETSPERLGTEAATAEITAGWLGGLTVRETAERATRAPSYVHEVFVRLERERGPRPVPGQLALINGHGAEPDAARAPRP
ncbi:hypothetical protein [Streptomyces sp. NPDC058045]|uniref:hypothetical protein n=1 Tax=Streptomyces sp. NPDC058045 TaxID=3346311 RepID=UPI0036F107C6